MMKVETLKDNRDIRILRCKEGNRIWYQMWLTENNWYDIHNRCMINLYDAIAIKYWWLRNLQQYYVFFYEKNDRKVRGVLGKDRTKDLLRSIL